jgi:hypothetical protein
MFGLGPANYDEQVFEDPDDVRLGAFPTGTSRLVPDRTAA